MSGSVGRPLERHLQTGHVAQVFALGDCWIQQIACYNLFRPKRGYQGLLSGGGGGEWRGGGVEGWRGGGVEGWRGGGAEGRRRGGGVEEGSSSDWDGGWGGVDGWRDERVWGGGMDMLWKVGVE